MDYKNKGQSKVVKALALAWCVFFLSTNSWLVKSQTREGVFVSVSPCLRVPASVADYSSPCLRVPASVAEYQSPRLPVPASAPEYLWYEAENMRGISQTARHEPVLNPSYLDLPAAKAPGWSISGNVLMMISSAKNALAHAMRDRMRITLACDGREPAHLRL